MVEQLETTRWIWKCLVCEDILVSYTHRRHDINYCECGKSAVDLENKYCRLVGPIEILSKKKLVDGKKWVTQKED
jgi:hypothetical protein